MPVRTYRLTSTATTGTVGGQSTTVIANGKIIGVSVTACAIGGAGTGSMQFEIALNNTTVSNANSASGAPSEQLITRVLVSYHATASGQQGFFVPLNIPVRQGNILCINSTFTGTAPTVVFVGFDAQVME